jgi:hypothetical protein
MHNIIRERPTKLYKFHKLDENLISLLALGRLWFSAQEELNDQCDCKYILSDEYLLKMLKKSSDKITRHLQERFPLSKNINSDKFLEYMMPTLKSDDWLNGLYNMLFNEGLGWCVCSFTSDPTNELMWAHYASCNKGVCLEFDFAQTPELYEKIFPVEYNDTLQIVNSIDELDLALLRKRTAWKYEKEWRILSNSKGYRNLNKASLTGIYFGIYVSMDKINIIRQHMIKSGYNNAEFKQNTLNLKDLKYVPFKNFN